MANDHSPESAACHQIERLLTSREADEILNVHAGFLNKDRCGPARIPFVRVGRAVRYRRADLEAFIAANVCTSTSDRRGSGGK